jgi:hypothetical protein
VLSPDSGQRAQATGSLDVSNQTDSNQLLCTDQRMP